MPVFNAQDQAIQTLSEDVELILIFLAPLALAPINWLPPNSNFSIGVGRRLELGIHKVKPIIQPLVRLRQPQLLPREKILRTAKMLTSGSVDRSLDVVYAEMLYLKD